MRLNTDKMIAEKDGGIGWMTFNNPARRNAMTLEMQQAIRVILEDFQMDEEVRVVIMKGAGDKAFVSGADISEFENKRSTPEAGKVYDQARGHAAISLASFEKPLIAMIQGFCMGGGLAMAIEADMRIASEDSQFAIPAARLGIGYPFVGAKALVTLVGPAWASEVLFSARRFSAQEAREIGLINHVVRRDELEETVRELAASIAANAPFTVKAAKIAIREAVKDREDRDMELCNRLLRECFESQDYIEGRRAFMEKRRPDFKGR